MHLLVTALLINMLPSASAAALPGDAACRTRECGGATFASNAETSPFHQSELFSVPKMTVDISLIQAAMLNTKVSTSQLQGNSVLSQRAAAKAVIKHGTGTHLAALLAKASKTLGPDDVEAVPDIAGSVKSAGSYKLIGFVVALVLVVSVVVYFLVIRPKLGSADSGDSGDSHSPKLCVDTTSPTESPGKGLSPTSSVDVEGDCNVIPAVLAGRCSFCPSLVVPPNSECSLVLPDMAVTTEPFKITDLHGHAVLEVVHKVSDPWQVELTTVEGDLLAKCSAAPGSTTGTPQYHFLRPSGEYFAKLQHEDTSSSKRGAVPAHKSSGNGQDSQCENYSISLPGGVRLRMTVSHEQLVDIMDESGQLLASLEPTITSPSNTSENHAHLRLRVAPESDAGLAVCAVLCVGHYTMLRR